MVEAFTLLCFTTFQNAAVSALRGPCATQELLLLRRFATIPTTARAITATTGTTTAATGKLLPPKDGGGGATGEGDASAGARTATVIVRRLVESIAKRSAVMG